MSKTANIRLKVLKAVAGRSHRYDRWRLLSQSFSLAVLAVVPLSGLAQVDFWGGNHYLLFERAPLRHALAGVITGIAAMYVVTFLSNVVAGRLFCGWGCPVAQVCRFGEALQSNRGKKSAAYAPGAAYSAAFVLSVLAWWVDPRMLIFGSQKSLLIGWGLFAIGVGGAYLHGRWWRWEFCKSACPIGVYYSFVKPAKYFGIHFHNAEQTCIECDACDKICPVDLLPRNLMAAVTDRRGVSLLEAPGFNHCIECGDCVRACERMIELKTPQVFPEGVPLRLGYFQGPQRVDPAGEADAKSQSQTSDTDIAATR